jgi:CheY-like chemotaxis protein
MVMPKLILVVEDDLAIRETVVELLHDEGYSNVASVKHGKEALQWLETAQEMPGLILLDMMMPVMDGESFLAALQEHSQAHLRQLPVVILSASRTRATLKGAVSWLDKPINIERLLSLVATYCGPSAMPSASPV